MYVKTLETACGWDGSVTCGMNAQFYYKHVKPELAGRMLTTTNPESTDPETSCVALCDQHPECDGFVWVASAKHCYFRKNTSCGRKANELYTCYTKIRSQGGG